VQWPFLAAAVLAVAFYRLGAMAVTVSVLSIALQGALQGALLVALAAGGAHVWRRLKGPDRG
jgi:hypothetical protein